VKLTQFPLDYRWMFVVVCVALLRFFCVVFFEKHRRSRS